MLKLTNDIKPNPCINCNATLISLKKGKIKENTLAKSTETFIVKK